MDKKQRPMFRDYDAVKAAGRERTAPWRRFPCLLLYAVMRRDRISGRRRKLERDG